MNDFAPLLDELDHWRRAGRTATLWWRDDDVQRDTPALQHLIGLSERHHAPLALACVPQGIDRGLADAVGELPGLSILQHGYSHANHAPAGEKKQELGPHRPPAQIADELRRGHADLETLFGDRFIPILVPPWNRIAPALLPLLPEIGFRGLSVSGPRERREAAPGLETVNVHVDIIDWHGSRGFVGIEDALAQFVAHLAARREGSVDTDEPTGLMTHHLVHDADCRGFLEQLLPLLATHPAVRWLTAVEAFQPT